MSEQRPRDGCPRRIVADEISTTNESFPSTTCRNCRKSSSILPCFGPSGTEGDSREERRPGFRAHNGPSVNCNARGVGRDRWPIEERIEDVQLPAGSK